VLSVRATVTAASGHPGRRRGGSAFTGLPRPGAVVDIEELGKRSHGESVLY